MESGLLYITAVIVLLIIGFVFALMMSRFAIQEADRGWPHDVAPTTVSDETEQSESAALVSPAEATANVGVH